MVMQNCVRPRRRRRWAFCVPPHIFANTNTTTLSRNEDDSEKEEGIVAIGVVVRVGSCVWFVSVRCRCSVGRVGFWSNVVLWLDVPLHIEESIRTHGFVYIYVVDMQIGHTVQVGQRTTTTTRVSQSSYIRTTNGHTTLRVWCVA